MFMKLAALQLMQQKANKPENAPTLENGSSPPSSSSPENGVEDGEKSPLEEKVEDGKMEESVAGLDQVKELTETIASDDVAGTVPSSPAEGPPFLEQSGPCCLGCPESRVLLFWTRDGIF